MVLMKKFKGDLGAALEAQQNSPLGMGSEFRPPSVLAAIYGKHPIWSRMSRILTSGSDWPLEPLGEEKHKKRCQRSNYVWKSQEGQVQPRCVSKPCSKRRETWLCNGVTAVESTYDTKHIFGPYEHHASKHHQQVRSNNRKGASSSQPKLQVKVRNFSE